MTLTTLSNAFETRVATMLYLADHPMRSWQLYPTPAQEKQQERYKRRARELISVVIDEYNRVNFKGE